MKRTLKLAGATLLALTWSGALFGASRIFNFDQDPASDPALNGAMIVGNHNYNNPLGLEQIWCSGGADPTLNPKGTNGNPATGGYLSVVDATNGNNALVFVFPDIDNGLPIKGFQLDADLRVGNGTLGRPADGFSISFARAGDIALQNATNGVVGGFAGGDGSYTAAQSPFGSGDVENGTKTGVAVIFDAWQGNWLPDTPQSGTGSSDREGIAVRIDDHTLVQLDLVNNRNERDCIVNGISTLQTNLSNTSPPTGGLSLQTGSNAVVTAKGANGCPTTYGNTDATGTFTNLMWAHLMVRLTNDPNPRLTVTYKGVQVINTNLTVFAASVGRLVMAGRAGGNNENTHVDNIVLNTVPATNAYIASIQSFLNGFILGVSDVAASTLQPPGHGITQILLDGVDVTSQTTQAYTNPVTYATYTQPTRFAPNSFHIVTATWVDSYQSTNTGAIGFYEANYVSFPTNFALPFSAVDTSKPGFTILPYQTRQASPNANRWTEEQIVGLHGNNIVGTPSVPLENGELVWNGPLGFVNRLGKATPASFFFDNSNPSIGGDSDFFDLGIAWNYPQDAYHDFYDNSALEVFSYVYFPTSGVYNMVMGNDDNFQLSVSQNTHDRMGNVLWFLNGNRVPNLNGSPPSPPNIADIRQVLIDQPGVYPIRLMWANGGGGAVLEWYTCTDPNALPAYGAWMVNDTNNASATPGSFGVQLRTYRALKAGVEVGPYVKKAIPVRDAQNVVFYSPIVVDLGDGSSNAKSVNASTVQMTVDGTALALSANHSGATTHITQTSTPNWSSGFHTNVLTFADNNGTNYTYAWDFVVLGNTTGVGVADSTNAVNYAQIPASSRVDPNTLNTPGFMVRPYQTMWKMANFAGQSEAQLEGLHGPNVAELSGTNGPGFFIWDDVFDFRNPATGGTGAQGVWTYDNSMKTAFGFQSIQRANSSQNMDNATAEIGGYMVFPTAGNYIMWINLDDGYSLTVPNGNNPRNKVGTVVSTINRGGGNSGTAGGVQTGGFYMGMNIPTAGAYPVRLIYYNGNGDSDLEWAIYQQLPDGSVAEIPIGDTNTPGAIKFYANSSASSTPYISYANPAPFAPDIIFYQPQVVDITDGAATVTPATIDSFSEDGNVMQYTATKSGNVTHLVQTLNSFWEINRSHTNTLVYHDSGGIFYTNKWPFSVINQSAFGVQGIPATNMVPLSAIDQTQPGFRIKSYQTPTATPVPGTMATVEAQFQGVFGANMADQSLTNGPGFFVWNDRFDFNDSVYGTGSGEGAGEWTWDNPLTTFGFQPQGGGTRQDYQSMNVGTYLYFPKAGTYLMVIDSDDGFRVTAPFGNPFNAAAAVELGAKDGTGGGANAGIGPRGGINYFTFSIPVAGAYPFRLLWNNATGGGSVEWSLFEYLSNGALAQVLLGDTNAPGGTVQAFQTTKHDIPYVQWMTPYPASVYGLGRPTLTFVQNNSVANTVAAANPITPDPTNNIVIGLASGDTGVNTSLPITLSLNGYVQPITVAPSTTNNLLLITRAANDTNWWPSGQLGPLILSYTDTAGRQISLPLETIATPFWGTLTNAMPLSAVNTNAPGFKIKTYAINRPGGVGFNTRIHDAEQVLAGLYGTNTINLANNTAGLPLTNGYFTFQGISDTNPVGVVNFDTGGSATSGADGDFQAPAFVETRWPGIPKNLNGNTDANSDNMAAEVLMYVEFPTNGTYTLGASSDDGFRVTAGWAAPTNIGSVIINSPASVAGAILAAADTSYASTLVTTPITANLALANGIGVEYGSTTNYEGCVINNDLTGKIAVLYHSQFCGYVQQVANAVAQGAVGVIIIQQNLGTSVNVLPNEPGVSPPLGIPAVEIEKVNGDALVAILATNGTVSATLTPMQYVVNPPPGTGNNVLGQADVGKGASDVLFPVVVQQAGVYPIRLVWFNGTGGCNLEFFSVTGGNRVLVNDLTKTTGPGPNGGGLRAWYANNALPLPTISEALVNGQIVITFTGTLQSSTSLTPGSFTDVAGSPTSPYTVPSGAPIKFYRARQ
jgi:PA domain